MEWRKKFRFSLLSLLFAIGVAGLLLGANLSKHNYVEDIGLLNKEIGVHYESIGWPFPIYTIWTYVDSSESTKINAYGLLADIGIGLLISIGTLLLVEFIQRKRSK